MRLTLNGWAGWTYGYVGLTTQAIRAYHFGVASSLDPAREPCEVAPFCPICGGKMQLVYDRPHQKVCVCSDCLSGLTVPQSAWTVAKTKREVNVEK
jgi:hypothetical protein